MDMNNLPINEEEQKLFFFNRNLIYIYNNNKTYITPKNKLKNIIDSLF